MSARARASIRCSPRSATATRSATRCSASSACCEAPGTSRRSSSRPPITGSRICTDRLPRDGRARSRRTTSSSTTSRSARARRERRTRCRDAWRSSTTTSRRREYFVGVHSDLVKLCFRGRRELTAYIDRVRSRARRLGVQPRRARGARLPAHRRPPGRARTSATSMVRPTRMLAADFDDGWTNVMFVGRVIPEQEVRDDHPRVPRLSHAPQPARRGCCSSAPTAASSAICRCCRSSSRSLGTPDVHFLGHVSNEELTALYDVADLFLCASAHEGFCVPIVEAFYKRVPVLAYASTAVPGDDGWRRRALRHDRSVRDRAADGGRARRSGARGGGRCSRRTPRSTGCRRATSPGRCCASSRTSSPARRGRRRTSRGTSGRSSSSSSGFEELRQFRPALFQALPAAPGSGSALGDRGTSQRWATAER